MGSEQSVSSVTYKICGVDEIDDILGVLTKPDRIPRGEEDRWTRFIKNEYEALDNGWFSVKQPDSVALASGISWAEARQSEREYFTSTSPWTELDFEYQSHLGTSNLTNCLSNILTSLIAKRLVFDASLS